MDNPKTEKEKTLLSTSMPNTPLTLGALQHEIAALKELLFTRIIAIEEGIEVAHADFVRFPTEVDKRIASTERFLGNRIQHVFDFNQQEVVHIKEKFAWIEKNRIEQKADLKEFLQQQKADGLTNLASALNAQKEVATTINTNYKEAMNKSEAYYSKQIEVLSQSQQSNFTILKDSITEIKLVVGQGIGKDSGQEKTRALQMSQISIVIAFLMMAFMMYKTLMGR